MGHDIQLPMHSITGYSTANINKDFFVTKYHKDGMAGITNNWNEVCEGWPQFTFTQDYETHDLVLASVYLLIWYQMVNSHEQKCIVHIEN